MKNRIMIIVLLLVFCGMGITPVNANENSKIIVGLDINVPPMGFLDPGGNISGFDVDMAKETFKSIGKEAVFQPIDWDSKELELSTDKIDVIWNGMSYTPEREKNMLLTKSYMKNNQVFIVKNSSDIFNLSDLNEKTVCIQKGSSGANALKSNEISNAFQNIVELQDMVSCLKEVELSKSDATVVDEVTARYYLNKNNLESEFRILDEPLSTESYVVAVKSDNQELKNQIESGLNEIINSGTAEKISENWFGKNVICFENVQSNKSAKKTDNSIYSEILKGLSETLKLFAICFLFSFPLGILLALIRNLKIKPIKFLIDTYISVMRGTPLLLQIFFAFYGLPILCPGLKLSNRFLIGTISFIINYAAYFTEIFRGGIKSINKSQIEAIKVLRIPKIKALFRIILPQIFKVSLPSICNETISLIKDTSLIFSIGIVELLTSAKNIVNQTANITAYIVVFALYLVICTLIGVAFKSLENKLNFE